MRTAAQCLARADELDHLATLCDPVLAAEYRRMAVFWRALSRQAEWQDSFPDLGEPQTD